MFQYYKCQKAKNRNLEEKGERKSSLWAPLNLILWDLKSNFSFGKEKDLCLFLPLKSLSVCLCFCLCLYRQTDKIYTSTGKVQSVLTD